MNITKMSETRTRYDLGTNSKGENIVVDITKMFNKDGKMQLPILWQENGYTKTILKSWVNCEVYVTDKDGNCWGKYNPTIKDQKIDFNWMLTANDKNIDKILKEVHRLAFN